MPQPTDQAQNAAATLQQLKGQAQSLAETSKTDFAAALQGMMKLTAPVLPEVRYDHRLKWQRAGVRLITLAFPLVYFKETPREEALDKIQAAYYGALKTMAAEAVHQDAVHFHPFVKLCRRLGCADIARATLAAYQRRQAENTAIERIAVVLNAQTPPALPAPELPVLPSHATAVIVPPARPPAPRKMDI